MKNNGINIAEWSVALSSQKLFYMAVMDGEAHLTFVNSHFFKSFQRTAASIKSKTFFDLMHPEDLPRFKKALEKTSSAGHSAMVETRMKHTQYKWVKWEISRLESSVAPSGAASTTSVASPCSVASGKYLCLGYDIAGEEQLKEYARIAGQNYQSIVEGLNIGVILQDKEGRIIAANRKASEILDVTLEDFYNNKDIFQLWKTAESNDESLPFANTPFRTALLTGESQTGKVMNIVTPDGHERSILWNTQPLCETDESGPSSVVSTLQDVTKEKKLEKEVKAREVLFTSFMDNTPYLSWIANEKGNLVYANQPMLTCFQADQGAFGNPISALLGPCLATAFQDKIDLVFKTGQPDHSTVTSTMADGGEHVFQLTVFPIQNISPFGMVGGKALDITESYHAAQEAKKVNERLFYISRATSEAIWDWNMATGQIFCNQALQQLVGSELADVCDLDWCYQSIHEEDRDKVERIIRDTLEQKAQSWEAEYRFLTIGGNFKTVYNRGFIIYENNQALRMIGSLQDISEIRKLENQLVVQRLKQHTKVAESIIHAQQEERARIGHELHDNVNQILTSAHLYLNLLTPDNPEFEEIREKASDITLLAIEEIRDLSKDMVMPDFKEDGLVGSIQHLVDDLRYTKLFNIEFTHNDKWGIELLDPNKKITLFRIVQEQSKNIIRYSKAKNISISLHCSDDQVRLLIRDDGKGFDATTTRRGLGLSNIYERTRLYNGKVRLNTAPGKGCALIVNIPLEGMP